MITIHPQKDETVLELIFPKKEILIKKAEVELAGRGKSKILAVCQAPTEGAYPYVTVANCVDCLAQMSYLFLEQLFIGKIGDYLDPVDFQKIVKCFGLQHHLIHFFEQREHVQVNKGNNFQLTLDNPRVCHLVPDEPQLKEYFWITFHVASSPEVISGRIEYRCFLPHLSVVKSK